MTRATPDTRQSANWLIAILLAIVLEGALRKWFLPASLHPLAYLFKDILALAFILRFEFSGHCKILERLRHRVIIIACLLFPSFLLGLTWSVTAAVMNFKNAVLWPLFATYMAACVDWRSLGKITRMLCFLCLAMAVLGYMQFSRPSSDALNRYAWHVMGKMEKIATFGPSSGVRATGTFSYITGYATFASVGFLWMIWRLLNSQSMRERSLTVAGAVACLTCIITSGSRAPLYQCVLGLMAAVAISSQLRHKRRVLLLFAVILASYVAVSNNRVVISFYDRLTAAGDSTTERIVGGGVDFVSLMLERPFGIGMGQESNVKDYRIAEQQASIEFTEDGRSRMASEGGVLAVLAQLVTLSVFLQIARLSWRTRNDLSKVAAAAMAPALLYLLTNCLWYDHNGSALWWFFIGAWLGVTLRSRRPSVIRVNLPVQRLRFYDTKRDRQPSVWQSEFV